MLGAAGVGWIIAAGHRAKIASARGLQFLRDGATCRRIVAFDARRKIRLLGDFAGVRWALLTAADSADAAVAVRA